MHNPQWKYDCTNCKFNWNCGPLCHCVLCGYPDPPEDRRREVSEARVLNGYDGGVWLDSLTIPAT